MLIPLVAVGVAVRSVDSAETPSPSSSVLVTPKRDVGNRLGQSKSAAEARHGVSLAERADASSEPTHRRSKRDVKQVDLAIASEDPSHNVSPQQPPAIIEEPGIPLAYAMGETGSLGLTEQEQTMLATARIGFEEKIDQAPSQDPDDPAFFDHWKDTRLKSDYHLRAMIGWERYNELSALASRQPVK